MFEKLPQSLQSSFGELPRPEPSEVFVQNVMARLPETGTALNAHMKGFVEIFDPARWAWSAAIAACALVVIIYTDADSMSVVADPRSSTELLLLSEVEDEVLFRALSPNSEQSDFESFIFGEGSGA